MPVVDDRGRLFGRINLIDALVSALVLAAIPLAYGAYALFRQPQPALTGIEPTTLTPTTKTVTVKGTNLRPFLRVSFNQLQGVTFSLTTPTTAEVRVPELPAGKYDVILYDVAREVSRLPGAVTVEAAPLPSAQASMLIAGSFVALDAASEAEIVKGAELTALGGNVAKIVGLGAPATDTRWVLTADVLVEVPLLEGKQQPALLETRCTIVERRCQVGRMDVEPTAPFSLFTKGGRPVRFVVREGMPLGPTTAADVKVRMITQSDAAPEARVGDRDKGSALFGDRLASLTAIGPSRRTSGDTMWHTTIPGSVAGDWSLTSDGASTFDVTIKLVLDRTSEGLRYRGHPLKVGAPFIFENERYVLKGWVLSVDLHADQRSSNQTSQ